MRFNLLLSILAFKFKVSALTNPDFKKFLMGHECRIVVKTKDNKKGKRFVFKDGWFYSDADLDDYDAAMVWSSPAIAFNAMKKGEPGIMEALQNHLVGIEGEIHSFTWFGAAMNFVMEKH
ncbi:MAG: hypothetical protein COX19_17285 [Desulfobacterales bacterium CG23_combo_of_CG06-09_8_20_14_all_51_8]|nr:MAG: hypothetical protein COX19_17285 [Desulfobacterales bacterium CG23_combo_of_CG06-09_8_20_14_all_51_8]